MKQLLIKIQKLRLFLGPHVSKLILKACFAGFFLFVIESSFVFIFQGFLRAVGLLSEDKLLLPSWYPRSMFWSLLSLILFGVFRGFAYMVKNYLAGITNEVFAMIQRMRLMSYALRNAGKVSSHEVINIFTDRIAQAAGVVNFISHLGLTSTTAFLLFLLGLKLAPVEMLIAITLLGIFIFPLKYLNTWIDSAGSSIVKKSEAATKTLIEGVKHNFFFRIYGLINQQINHGERNLFYYQEEYRKYYLIFSFKTAYAPMIGTIIIALVTFISRNYIHTASITLVSFFYIFIRLAQTASEAATTLTYLRLQLPGFKRLYEWHQKYVEADELEAQKVKKMPEPGDEIKNQFHQFWAQNGITVSARSLSFSYSDTAKMLFSNLDFDVKRGEVLLVKGESGVGKSTLLTLILGLNSSSRGSISVNNLPVEQVSQLMHPHIAYVGPEPYMIPGTIGENLLFGHPYPEKVQKNDLQQALARAQIAREIEALPNGIHESLQEHAELSTGQKQRIAIARALLRNPSLLILDEATANLDHQTEAGFIASLKEILPSLTTIVISHKSSFDQLATHRIELKK